MIDTDGNALLWLGLGQTLKREEQLANVLRTASTDRVESIVDLATQICLIPAPTGKEIKRSDFVRSLLEEQGYCPQQDLAGNVYVRRGDRGGPILLVAAHLDTVFPAETAISVTRDGNYLQGPAIGDNSLGVAAMLETLRILDHLEIETDTDIVFVADVGEEGLGNLSGIRTAVDHFQNEIGAVVAVEGHNLGRITVGAVGSRRIEIIVRGSGGHSWGAFGQPSAIDGIAKIVTSISGINVSADPRTTYNVGLISGGTSINTIASEASCQVDMRSIDEQILRQLAQKIESIVWQSCGDGLQAEIRLLGERPAGQTPRTHQIVKVAAAALRSEGYDPKYDASSTDANIPISRGIPAICIGITHGGKGHTTEEFISIPPIPSGVTQLLSICANLPRSLRAGVK